MLPVQIITLCLENLEKSYMGYCLYQLTAKSSLTTGEIDVRGPYVTPELNNELQCNVGNL